MARPGERGEQYPDRTTKLLEIDVELLELSILLFILLYRGGLGLLPLLLSWRGFLFFLFVVLFSFFLLVIIFFLDGSSLLPTRGGSFLPFILILVSLVFRVSISVEVEIVYGEGCLNLSLLSNLLTVIVLIVIESNGDAPTNNHVGVNLDSLLRNVQTRRHQQISKFPKLLGD